MGRQVGEESEAKLAGEKPPPGGCALQSLEFQRGQGSGPSRGFGVVCSEAAVK